MFTKILISSVENFISFLGQTPFVYRLSPLTHTQPHLAPSFFTRSYAFFITESALDIHLALRGF